MSKNEDDRWGFLPDLVLYIFLILMSGLVIGFFWFAATHPNFPN